MAYYFVSDTYMKGERNGVLLSLVKIMGAMGTRPMRMTPTVSRASLAVSLSHMTERIKT